MVSKMKLYIKALSVLASVLILMSALCFVGITALAQEADVAEIIENSAYTEGYEDNETGDDKEDYEDYQKTLLDTPVLNSVSVSGSGIQITWGTVSGAEKYRVFYKANNESTWHKIGDTADTNYVWAKGKIGTEYRFTVRCISSDLSSYTSLYDTAGLSIKYCATPKITSVSNNAGGVNLSWGKVNGAEKYRVFFKLPSGTWTKITDTFSTSYTWTGAESGKKYLFTVRCLTADGKSYLSDYDRAENSITYLSAPELINAYAANSGVVINWDKVSGAANYRVFYKANGESSWHKIADTTSTSYTWKSAKIGTSYTFTVRCVSKDGRTFTSSYNKKGLSVTPVNTPVLSSVSANSKGTLIEWNAVKGAEKYRVFRKTANGSWTTLGTTASTSFTDSTAANGTKYTYTVRCVTADGKTYTSGYNSTGISIKAVASPILSEVSNTATGVKISWDKVSGAEKYRVFYKANGESSWHKITDTTSTSYTWTGVKSGTDYTITVRCVSADGKMYVSGYDAEGLSIKYLSAPKLSSVSITSTGVKISWDKVNGAEKYRVFYKANGESSWHKITDTASTSYVWTEANYETNYRFTVRCINEDGTEYTSFYDGNGMVITYLSTPNITSAAGAVSGVQLKWDKVSGAAKYRVFYKNSTGGWSKIADSASTSYTWANASIGATYIFTVRCVSSDGKVFESWYNSAGTTLTYYPTLNSKANAAAKQYDNCTRYVYGKSAMGNQLEAYIIEGNGSNNRILFMDFAVHGFEDEYSKDGKVLVNLGNSLVEYYAAHPELLYDYKLVIVPCANPDGTMFGKNNYRAEVNGAFGRCTYKGIDINRDFKAGGFKAKESVALKNLMNTYKPNVYLNFHGWEDSVLGNPQLVSVFRSKVGLKTDKSNHYGSESGFIIEYVKNTYNAKAALIEFKNSQSVSQTKVENAINYIIKNKF